MTALFMTWVILFAFVLVLYVYGKSDFTSPSFFLGFVFLACYTIVIYNIRNWDIAIHGYRWETTLCVLATVLPFTLGSMIVSGASNRKNVNLAAVDPHIEKYSRNYPYLLFGLLSLAMFALFLRFKVKNLSLSSMLNFKDSLNENYSNEKEYGFFTTQILEVLVALAYISFHRVLVEKHYLKRKVHKSLFIPIVLFLFGALLYTDRNIFLRFMIFGLTSFVMSFNWKGVTRRNNRKLMLRVTLAVVAIAGLFWLYGYLKEYTSNFERMVGIYAGSGLYGFNLWLKSFNNHFTNGELSFSTLLNTLKAFGVGSGTQLSQKFEFIIYTSRNGYVFATNIYSALRVYYQDYGVPGIIAISFIMGLLFEGLYQMAVKRKYGFGWVFYCAHIYHVLYFPILEQFLTRLHLGIIYEIFWLFFFYYLVYGRHGLGRVKVVWSSSGTA